VSEYSVFVQIPHLQEEMVAGREEEVNVDDSLVRKDEVKDLADQKCVIFPTV